MSLHGKGDLEAKYQKLIIHRQFLLRSPMMKTSSIPDAFLLAEISKIFHVRYRYLTLLGKLHLQRGWPCVWY